MFKNKTLPWKTSKPNFVAFLVLIGMAFSFISEILASLKRSGNRDAMSARKTLFTGLVYANGI